MKTEDIKNIARAWQQVQEKLKGNQHKLDMDKDGDIDATDFKHMRKKKANENDAAEMNPKKKVDKNASLETMTTEETEQIDEISKDLAGRYIRKAQIDTADAADKVARSYDAYDKKKGEKDRKAGISRIVRSRMGTADAVRKLTGKARVGATESYEVVNEGSYERSAYGKGHVYDRGEAHEDAARHHDMEAEKHEKARNFETADLHTAASKAHQKAADYFSRLHSKREKGGGTGVASTVSSRAAHEASQKANSFKESAEWLVYDRIKENRAAHYKGATAPETSDDKLKGAGAKKMKADFAGNAADPDFEEKGHDDASKAGRITKKSPARTGDQAKGDKSIINKPKDNT